MTTGVLQAVQLRDMAKERLAKAAGSGTAAAKRAALQGLPAAFHAKLPEVLDFPWNLATGTPFCSASGLKRLQSSRTLIAQVHGVKISASALHQNAPMQAQCGPCCGTSRCFQAAAVRFCVCVAL
jgi:hypothetical protein